MNTFVWRSLRVALYALTTAVLCNAASPAQAQERRAPAAVWKQLESSQAIVDGMATAPRTVYVFMDANCPFCTKFWNDARPWVDSGKVALRHMMVGILTPSSPGKAAALLADKDPARALAAHERAHTAEAGRTLASGEPQPLGDQGLKPLASIPPAIRKQLDGNRKMMLDLGIQGTPGLVWRDGAGRVHARTGAPDAALAQIMGPK